MCGEGLERLESGKRSAPRQGPCGLSCSDARRCCWPAEPRLECLAPGQRAGLSRDCFTKCGRSNGLSSDAVLDYLQAIVRFTREHPELESGLSPRAAIALMRAAQAWALIHHRNAVVPEDVQAILPSVVGHRLQASHEVTHKNADQISEELLADVPIP